MWKSGVENAEQQNQQNGCQFWMALFVGEEQSLQNGFFVLENVCCCRIAELRMKRLCSVWMLKNSKINRTGVSSGWRWVLVENSLSRTDVCSGECCLVA
jgi:hypothetical protein